MFHTPSAQKNALIENLTVPALYVFAQAAASKETVSYAQISDAIIKAMTPADDTERAAMENALSEMLRKNVLVQSGYLSAARPRAGDAAPIVNITQRGMALLGRRCVDLVALPEENAEVVVDPDATRNLEKDIQLPMLVTLVKLHVENGLPVQMKAWREGTKQMLRVGREDMDPLLNRSDTKLDQVIRNNRSHNTLGKLGWIHESKEGTIPTERGMARVGQEFLKLLPVPNFKTSVEEPEPTPQVRPRMRRG